MENPFLKNETAEELPVIHNENFFLEDSYDDGVTSKEQYIEDCKLMNNYDYIKLHSFFEQMKQRYPLHISILPSENKNTKKPYYHVVLRSENGSSGYKLYAFKGVEKIIKTYIMDGKRVELDLHVLKEKASQNNA
ncbi:hypothetical protein [Sphingobacterium paludis]|uniref:Uncharacterized protein n=1 Tax=Sphingobacterium paludis TaxID=1476465 RepID=A0A4R7CVU2_9SPHI|nr:hypothetical protein [Sphingobacterium paludis]TDS11942.1 hypothetical protein B0I21_107294 [Sphingobacterium paludis]